MFFCLFPGLHGRCEFPKFLRMPMVDGTARKWTSETKYIDNTNLWATQLEITVTDYRINAKLKYKVSKRGGCITAFSSISGR